MSQSDRWARIRQMMARLNMTKREAHAMYFAETGRKISRGRFYALLAEKCIERETQNIESWLDRKTTSGQGLEKTTGAHSI